MAIVCPACGVELPNEATFCDACWAALVAKAPEKPRFCTACGTLLREGARFCLACGTEVSSDTADWHQKKNDEVDEAIVASFLQDPKLLLWERIIDFEAHKHEIAYRAMKLAEYYGTLMTAPDWFVLLYTLGYMGFTPSEYWLDSWNEFIRFYTNKPNAHKALFQRTIIETYLSEAKARRYLLPVGSRWDFSPTALAYLDITYYRGTLATNPITFTAFDYAELEALAKRDDELFPPSELIHVEVAGTTLDFTTDEGVLVVYLDCAHHGETVHLGMSESYIGLEYPHSNAEVFRRAIGGMVFCAAVFNHIPFVTKYVRNKEKVLTRMDASVWVSEVPDWERQTVTIVRGQVTQLDWRGRKEKRTDDRQDS